jgi:hypothetical protein
LILAGVTDRGECGKGRYRGTTAPTRQTEQPVARGATLRFKHSWRTVGCDVRRWVTAPSSATRSQGQAGVVLRHRRFQT